MFGISLPLPFEPPREQRIVEVLVEGRRGPRIAAAAAHAPPAGILDKVSQHPLSHPRAPGVTPSAIPQLPQSRPSKRRPAVQHWHRHPLLPGQAGQSCASTGLQKVPQAAVPVLRVPQENEAAAGKPATAAAVPHSPRQPPGTPALGTLSAAAAAARASLRRASRGRLRLPLSPAARAVVTPLSVSAAGGGAGKWLAAC